MKIKLLDGVVKEFNQPKTVIEIAESIAISLKKNTVAAIVNNIVVPTDFVITKDSDVEFITNKSNNYNELVYNTAGLITMAAIRQLVDYVAFAEIISNNEEMEFSITFDIEDRFKLEDLVNIQTKVNELKGTKITSNTISIGQAKEIFKNNKYQLYLANKMFDKCGYVLIYKINNTELVFDKGIILNSKIVKEIEIQQLTGSYWLNDSEKEMLQRVHGIGATSKEELENTKAILEERRNSDHRQINKQLKIFDFDNLVGAGLPLWLPNGTILRDEIKKYLKEKEWEYDYVQINTPIIGTIELYKTSGHWEHYGGDMFQPFSGGVKGGEQFIIKPMSCPHHVSVYKTSQRSYRDLPIRFAEHAIQHRYESSGSLTGLERVRSMELTDSHIFVRPDQVGDEFKSIYKLVKEVLETFDLKIDYLSLSLRDSEDKVKYYQDDKMWNEAEQALENVLKEMKVEYKKCIGEAAFYGPKLDIQMKTAQNHEVTISTIQLDFLLPQRFDVTYIDANQEFKRPIMIHRGLIGTYERFVATLLEQTKGVLPLWLAPIQIEIIPIGDEKNFAYAEEIKQELKRNIIRTHIDTRDERLSYKIRDAQINKIPYQLVLGNTETESKQITYRKYGSDEQTTISFDEFKKMLTMQIKEKK